jgi:hypothetical protein
MRKLLILMLLGSAGALAQDAPQSPATLIWKHVFSQYKSMDEIKPVLANDGGHSVFLSRIWPDGSAQLQRFNDTSGKWEFGYWGIRCGTVSQPDVPIEIQSKTERDIHVYWQLSTDDWDNPKHFVVQGSSEQRALEGKYRFVLRYSLKPWTVFQHPDVIYTIISPEFSLRGSPSLSPAA